MTTTDYFDANASMNRSADKDNTIAVGRFAPSPTGRMHLGNIYAAVMSWLDVKCRGGRWILRHEDLDPQRSKLEYAKIIEDDLHWLGLEWDEGGLDNIGGNGPYLQSLRHGIYLRALAKLQNTGMCYPCTCTRAELRASSAPHLSDGRLIYSGKCRPTDLPRDFHQLSKDKDRYAVRLAVPDRYIEFDDAVYGHQSVNIAKECGDFVLRRADGAWAYQLAVVVDDMLMGVNRVTRGCDLLLSAAQQTYIYSLLGGKAPAYMHLPLICNEAGQRLSKRDQSLSMAVLRQSSTPERILGLIAQVSGQQPTPAPISLPELLGIYKETRIPTSNQILPS